VPSVQTSRTRGLRNQVSDLEVIDDPLNVLDSVLHPIKSLAQSVVSECEVLEPCMEFLDEYAALDGHGEVTQCDKVCHQPTQFLSERSQGQEILLDRDMKRVTVLQVCRYYVKLSIPLFSPVAKKLCCIRLER
jgi:hypothetical protein